MWLAHQPPRPEFYVAAAAPMSDQCAGDSGPTRSILSASSRSFAAVIIARRSACSGGSFSLERASCLSAREDQRLKRRLSIDALKLD